MLPRMVVPVELTDQAQAATDAAQAARSASQVLDPVQRMTEPAELADAAGYASWIDLKDVGEGFRRRSRGATTRCRHRSAPMNCVSACMKTAKTSR